NKKLLEQGSVDASLAKEMEKDFRALLQERLNESKESTAFSEPNPMYSGAWTGLRMAVPEDFTKTYNTAVSKDVFLSIAEQITTLPDDKKFFRKIEKLFEERRSMVENGIFDWAMGELMAY